MMTSEQNQRASLVYGGFLQGLTMTEYLRSEVDKWLSTSRDGQPSPEPVRCTRNARFADGAQPGGTYGETMQIVSGDAGYEHELMQAAIMAGNRAALTLKLLAEKNGGSFVYTAIAEASAYASDGLLDVEGVSVLYQTCHDPHTISWAFADVKELAS